MLQVGRRPDFGEEALTSDHSRELRPEDFERDLTVVTQVPGEIDRGHTATPELALDVVAFCQCCG